jgi:adenine deaminase
MMRTQACLLGADTPQIMQVPGWATHGELKALVASGLSPYRALRAGTINVAQFFGTTDRTGTVAAGKEASLVLVDANPLEDVAKHGEDQRRHGPGAVESPAAERDEIAWQAALNNELRTTNDEL